MANEALNALTAQIVSQSFQEKLSEKRRRQRLQQLTQSFRSLGFGDNAGAIATRVAAGAPLSASEIENINAEGHLDEIRENFPEGFAPTGLTAGQEQRLAFQASGVRLGSFLKEEELTELLNDYATARQASRAGNLFAVDPLDTEDDINIKSRGILAATRLWPNLTGKLMNKLLTNRFDPANPKLYGVDREAWNTLTKLVSPPFNVRNARDLINLGTPGILALAEFKIAFDLSSDAEVDQFLGAGEGVEHLYGMAQQSVQSELQLLAGGKDMVLFKFQDWVKMVPDPNNAGQLISQLELDDPITFNHLENFYHKEGEKLGQLRTASIMNRASDLQQLFDITNRLRHLTPQRTARFYNVVAILAQKPDEQLDFLPDSQGGEAVTRTTLKNDYHFTEQEIDMIIELVLKIKSGQFNLKDLPGANQ